MYRVITLWCTCYISISHFITHSYEEESPSFKLFLHLFCNVIDVFNRALDSSIFNMCTLTHDQSHLLNSDVLQFNVLCDD